MAVKGSQRFLFLAGAVFLVILFGYLVHPSVIPRLSLPHSPPTIEHEDANPFLPSAGDGKAGGHGQEDEITSGSAPGAEEFGIAPPAYSEGYEEVGHGQAAQDSYGERPGPEEFGSAPPASSADHEEIGHGQTAQESYGQRPGPEEFGTAPPSMNEDYEEIGHGQTAQESYGERPGPEEFGTDPAFTGGEHKDGTHKQTGSLGEVPNAEEFGIAPPSPSESSLSAETSSYSERPASHLDLSHDAFGVAAPSQTESSASIGTPSQVARPTSHLGPSYGGNVSTDGQYVEISGRMMPDGTWFPIDFGDYGSYNPNLLPHPYKNDTWVMIAQGKQTPGDAGGPVYSLELVCDATFTKGKLQCTRSPLTLPIASTVSPHCTGELDWFNLFIGPNDPRVFLGPDKPYIMYGSASEYTCLGQYIHDLRRLYKWGDTGALDTSQRFFWPTELKRPPPYSSIEKNWFAFWDKQGEMYIHYNIVPKRVFAKVDHDGSKVSGDLAPQAAESDSRCQRQYMPQTNPTDHIHQATNSLAITMCESSDRTCKKDDNTYIFTIFHHKQYHGHNLYEPYIMLFKQTSPFEIHAIASKPFWISGRGKPGGSWSNDTTIPADESQMMYITSMSWKDPGMTYQGYLDDELLISFGIEDNRAGAIDVVAGDLIRELNFCT